MRENRDFVVPVNILTTFAHAPFSWAARHTTVCLDVFYIYLTLMPLISSIWSPALRPAFVAAPW